jgi:hypothetical protein
MHTQQWILAAINIVGGILVIGSYVQGFLAHPDSGRVLWGGVPESIRPLYTLCMVPAALGYFAFTYFIMFRLDPEQVKIGNLFDFRIFLAIYALILLPSALWMPLTRAMVDNPSPGLLWSIRVTLAVVGLASLSLLAALLTVDTKQPAVAYWAAVAGSAAFCLQTAVLDAIVWNVYFRY